MIRLIRLGNHGVRPTLIVIPGLDGTIGSVEPVVTHLARKREVVVVDYSAETNDTLENLAAEITTTLKAENYEVIDLMGQSIGTILAAQLAAGRTLPVRKVVLSCTFTRLRWGILRLVVIMLRVTPRPLYRLTSDFAVILACGPVGDGRQHPAFAAARNSDKAAAARRTRWEINRDFSADLARIDYPLLVLMGERDRFVPNAEREVIKLRDLFASRSGCVETIPDAGHIFLPSAAIALASDAIEQFLE